MSESRWEIGLRAAAWAALAATVGALLGIGVLTRPQTSAAEGMNLTTTDWVSAAGAPPAPLEDGK